MGEVAKLHTLLAEAEVRSRGYRGSFRVLYGFQVSGSRSMEVEGFWSSAKVP